MAFKNAFKIMVNRFGIAWSIALYLFILFLVLGALSLVIIVPILKALKNSGITEQIYNFFNNILAGKSIDEIGIEIKQISDNIVNLFRDNKGLTIGSITSFIVIMYVVRFTLGFYELPTLTVLEGAMSSNAKLSYMGCFISKLGLSSKYILVKTIYTIPCDALIVMVVYLMFMLFSVPFFAIFTLAFIMLFVIIALAAKSTFIAMWGAAIVCNGTPIFYSLGFSIKKALKHFKSLFSNFALSWMFIISLNLFVGIFTFGAGLIATVPISMLFLNILSMTIFYGKNNKRYYVDDVVINPPRTEDAILVDDAKVL